jgi:hypothetical protein
MTRHSIMLSAPKDPVPVAVAPLPDAGSVADILQLWHGSARDGSDRERGEYNPYTGPLLVAAHDVLQRSADNIGLGDEEFLPFVEARRFLYGDSDSYVAMYDRDRFRSLVASGEFAVAVGAEGQVAPGHDGRDAYAITASVSNDAVTDTARSEFISGIRFLGRLGIAVASQNGTTSVPVPEHRFLKLADFAVRHGVSLSTVKYWRRLGLATNGVEGRGVRVNVVEADAWLAARGPKLALAAAGARHARCRKK